MSTERRTSRIPGLYKLPVRERLERVRAFAELPSEELDVLVDWDPAVLDRCDRMIENVIGAFDLPVGVAANFRINGEDRLLPMVIEEPSVVAAASNAAKLLRAGPGIVTSATAPEMIGQLQLCDVPDPEAAHTALMAAEAELVEAANATAPRLIARGGGARGVEVRLLPESPVGPMVVLHLIVDVRDAMGANLVNGMVEAIAERCAGLAGGRARLRILSNLADRRRCMAEGRVPLSWLDMPSEGLSGREVATGIVEASAFAEVDPYRAATHNKGIMNGVDAFLLATGQDWRAMEAGVHAYAARSGRYGALATWRIEEDALVGRIDLPVQVGIVGGVTRVHPAVRALLAVVAVQDATELGQLAAAVGLAQNLAAIKALATEGIQRGHMSLHARNIVASLGASKAEIDEVVGEMVRRRRFTHADAEQILQALQARVAPPSPAPTVDRAAITALRDRLWPEVLAHLVRLVPEGAPPSLAEAIDHQLATGGKRLRAVLPLAVGEALGADPRALVPLAAAVELLHNATMVHEDIQAQRRTRRGQPSLWAQLGETRAMTTGDGLLLLAIRCVAGARRAGPLVERITATMLRVVDAQMRARGTAAMTVADVRERVGGLFSLALAGAAVVAAAPDAVVEALEGAGSAMGLVLEIQDELMALLHAEPVVGLDTPHGLIVAHALAQPGPAADKLRALAQDARNGAPAATADVLDLLEQTGSLAFATELVAEQHAALVGIAADLPDALGALLSSVTGLFLDPLLQQAAARSA